MSKRDDPKFGIDVGTGSLRSLLPSVESEPRAAEEKPEQPMPSKTYPKLIERKAVQRLRYIATMDDDLTVRAAAKLALQRIAELPEPLSVRPREVRP